MCRLKPFCGALSLFICLPLTNCAVKSALSPFRAPSSAHSTKYLSHVAIDQESLLSMYSTVGLQHQKRYPSTDQKGYRGDLTDFLDEKIAEDAAIQVITSVTRGGPRILFDPSGADGSMVPLMLNAMNETSDPVREVIMFDDLWGQIPTLTNVYWKDLLKNFESWFTAMQATNTTIPPLPNGLPRILTYPSRRETLKALKEVILLCARVGAWKDLFDTKRTDLDTVWKTWDTAARRLNKPALWDPATRQAWEDEASALERDVVDKKAAADAHLAVQRAWGGPSTEVVTTEMDRLVHVLDDRVANLTAQRTWYADVINATGSPLNGEGEAGFWMQRGMEKARDWEERVRRLPGEAVGKVREALDRLRDLQEPWLVEEDAYLKSKKALIERTQRFMVEARQMASEMRARPTVTTVRGPETTREVGWDVSAKVTESFAWGRD